PFVADDLVDVHVELGAAACHPELVLVLSLFYFVADAHNQVFLNFAKPAGVVVDQRGRLLDGGVGGNHLPGDQIIADAEVLQGPLRLRSPELSDGTFTGPRLSCSTRVVVMNASG